MTIKHRLEKLEQHNPPTDEQLAASLEYARSFFVRGLQRPSEPPTAQFIQHDRKPSEYFLKKNHGNGGRDDA